MDNADFAFATDEREAEDIAQSARVGSDDDVRRIALRALLPCAMPRCEALASFALAEPDPGIPGVWLLLPLCGEHDHGAN